MTPSKQKDNSGMMIQTQLLEQGLDWTPTNHDRHFVKHIKNM